MSDCYDLDVEVESLDGTDLEALLEAPGGHVEIGIEAFVGLPGKQGPPGTGAPLVEAENVGASTIFAGMAVARHNSGTGFIRADKAAYSTRAIGVATTTAAPGFSLAVATAGPVELDDWTAATGQATLPTAGPLWLGSEGAITQSLAGDGQVQQLIGEVISPTKLAVHRGEPRIRRV